MGFIQLKCPNCGANAELSEDREFCFCNYCGTKLVREKIVVEHRGKVSLDGFANEKSLLDRAYIFLEDEKFSDADAYFERVLDINPRCSEAYLGKLMCENNCRRLEQIFLFEPLSSNSNYKNAIKFATEEEKNKLENLRELFNKKYKNDLDKITSEIADIRIEFKDKESFINKNKARVERFITKKFKKLLALIILGFLTIAAIVTTFDAIKTNNENLSGFIAETFIFGGVFAYLLLSYIKLKKLTYKYKKYKSDLLNLKNKYDKLSEELVVWKNNIKL